jgi:hypothetical protein
MLYLLPVVSLAIVVALAVDTPPKSGFCEESFFHLPLLSQPNLSLENINLPTQIIG